MHLYSALDFQMLISLRLPWNIQESNFSQQPNKYGNDPRLKQFLNTRKEQLPVAKHNSCGTIRGNIYAAEHCGKGTEFYRGNFWFAHLGANQ